MYIILPPSLLLFLSKWFDLCLRLVSVSLLMLVFYFHLSDFSHSTWPNDANDFAWYFERLQEVMSKFIISCNCHCCNNSTNTHHIHIHMTAAAAAATTTTTTTNLWEASILFSLALFFEQTKVMHLCQLTLPVKSLLFSLSYQFNPPVTLWPWSIMVQLLSTEWKRMSFTFKCQLHRHSSCLMSVWAKLT